ncbi:MAG: hypothetical protein SFV81_28770, partial [Pirellulaceae bacterium]|nr:hypothetical protein [Pirellulaceae bacterium]
LAPVFALVTAANPSSIPRVLVALESLDGFRYPRIDKPLTHSATRLSEMLDAFRYVRISMRHS